jgi:hypothetical protein
MFYSFGVAFRYCKYTWVSSYPALAKMQCISDHRNGAKTHDQGRNHRGQQQSGERIKHARNHGHAERVVQKSGHQVLLHVGDRPYRERTRNSAAREAAEASAKATKRRLMSAVPLIALVAVLGFQYDALRFWAIGPSQAAVSADLDAALNQATIDVRAYKLRTGALPEKLPNAALSAVVTYKKTGQGSAELTARIGSETKTKRI